MERQPAMASMYRNPSCCYIADDDDDDDHHPPPRPSERFNRSLDDIEAGFSHHRRRPFLDSLFRRETRRYEYREPHFLDSCYLCKNTLRSNKDIFMYRCVKNGILGGIFGLWVLVKIQAFVILRLFGLMGVGSFLEAGQFSTVIVVCSKDLRKLC